MTQTLTATPAPVPGGTRTLRLLRATAIAACLPYLGLKVAWIARNRGFPRERLRRRCVYIRVAMGSPSADSVIGDLLLTRPWGLRVPAWAMALPVWVATGLLAPIMAGFPLQLLTRALGGDTATSSGAEGEPFLDSWVFGVVYTGFIVQGLALGALFARYARRRWGRLWRGRVRDLPAGVVRAPYRAVAVVGAVLASFPLAVRLYWLCGGSAGLRDGERTADVHVLEGMHVAFLAAAAAGTLLLAFRGGRALPVPAPLAANWVCSAATACWGGWMLLALLLPADDPADRPTTLLTLTYAGQMTVGLLLASVGAHFLARRSAAVRTLP
ncbi:hypothetical protein [Streptomyces sp. DHE17-7]|uniref:hypothetical protein n=1 Tax=Streptomyces sp. DHE17-7 TaxID=2759949 RepID=UPI0022EA2453|nr:hypothetical protein [Streptomyces sp. DHE17-7]MBJ6619030.1 hypothetical protein [Streptomyces sp. DHE17-7]